MDSRSGSRIADRNESGERLEAALERSLAVARELSALLQVSPASPHRLEELIDRLREGRFNLAVLGQFKRGKSTFLNALLGVPLMPTGIIPLTALPVFLAWGAEPLIRIHHKGDARPEEFHDSEPDAISHRLFDYVAEEANPENRRKVARVELYYPADLLRQNITLIDTPGIGSTYRHNTEAALRVLAECDAALFIVSPDPPITEMEVSYLDAIGPHVDRLIFVLSKADYLEPQDRPIAAAFLAKAVGKSLDDVFVVSALKGLRAKQREDADDALEQSGIVALERYLFGYLAHAKASALQGTIAKKAAHILSELAEEGALSLRALEMPIEELQARAGELATALSRIESEKHVIRDLLEGNRRRAVEKLEQHADALRDAAREKLSAVLDRAFSDRSNSLEYPRAAIAAAIPQFFETELRRSSVKFTREIEGILATHQRRIDDLVGAVRRTAAELFQLPMQAAATSEPLTLKREPYWVTEKFSDTIIGNPAGLVARLLPSATRRERTRRHFQEQIDALANQNVENLRWATLQALNDTFRRFAAEFENRLTAAIAATQGAAEAAKAKRRSTSESNAGEIESIKRCLAALEKNCGMLQEFGESEATLLNPSSRSSPPEGRQTWT